MKKWRIKVIFSSFKAFKRSKLWQLATQLLWLKTVWCLYPAVKICVKMLWTPILYRHDTPIGFVVNALWLITLHGMLNFAYLVNPCIVRLLVLTISYRWFFHIFALWSLLWVPARVECLWKSKWKCTQELPDRLFGSVQCPGEYWCWCSELFPSNSCFL